MTDEKPDNLFATDDKRAPIKDRIQKGMQEIHDEIRDLQAVHEKLGRIKERARIISNLAEALNRYANTNSVEERTRQAVYMNIIAELTEGSVR